MAIYKAILQGSYAGQAVNNLLYYRNAPNTDLEGLTFGGTQELCTLIKSSIWPHLQAVMVPKYTLASITAYVYSDNTFQLMYQNPYTLAVDEPGQAAGVADGSMTTLIFKFGLEPVPLIGNGPKPPKRGYVAVGPVNDTWLDDEGHVQTEFMNNPSGVGRALCDALSTNLASLIPPALYYPIRVHSEKVLGIFHITSYADVNSCSIRRLSSFRRSRQLEF